MSISQSTLLLTEILIIIMLMTLIYGVILFVKYKKFVFAQIYLFALVCITSGYLYEAILFMFIPNFDWSKMTVADVSDIGYFLLIMLMYKLMKKTIGVKIGVVNIYSDKKTNIFSFVIALIIILLMFVGAIIISKRATMIVYYITMPLAMYSIFLNIRMLLYTNKEKKYLNSMKIFNFILLLLMLLQIIYYSFPINGVMITVFDLLYYPLSFLSMIFLVRGLKQWI